MVECLEVEVASAGAMEKETFSATKDQQSVDPKVIRELREIATADQVSQLIDLFLHTLEQNLASMHAAMSNRDTTALAKLAHGLKGTAAGMGATFLAILSHELQESSKHGMLEEVDARFNRVENETQRVRRIFEKEKTQPST
jgi:HPt (histidine-containing phosphotransfer) domain-containing protein